MNEKAKDALERQLWLTFLFCVAGFALAAWCLWYKDYHKYYCPLWIGLAIVVTLLILTGWGLRTIWPYKALEGTKVFSLIYMATLTIMAICRVFEPWLR